MAAPRLWLRFWLLFTAIWVVVSLLHALTLAFADEVPADRLPTLLLATIVVPSVLYGLGRLWEVARGPRD